MLDPEQNAAFRDLYLEAWSWVRFGERSILFVSLGHTSGKNRLTKKWGEGIVEASLKHAKTGASQVLLLELGQFPHSEPTAKLSSRASKNMLLILLFR